MFRLNNRKIMTVNSAVHESALSTRVQLLEDAIVLKALITETGNKIALVISNWKIKAILYDKNDNVICTSDEVSIPRENLDDMVTGGSYNTSTKKITLTRKTSADVELDLSSIINGLQTTIDSSHKLSASLVDDSGSTNKFATESQLGQIETNRTAILAIKDDSTLDSFGDVAGALLLKEDSVNKVTSTAGWSSTLSDTKYPSEKLTKLSLDNKVDKDYKTGLSSVYKVLSDNNFTDDYLNQVSANTTARHTHTNKTLLDTYTQTESDLADAVSSKHTHSNKSVLDAITAAYTTEDATRISTIEGKIPAEATASNKLADKAFVNSTINSLAAYFKGNFDNYQTAAKTGNTTLMGIAWQTSDPTAPYYVTNNDYAYINDDETHSHEAWRYIYVSGTGSGTGWQPQFRVNEAPFSQSQLDAINSGVTAQWVTDRTYIEYSDLYNRPAFSYDATTKTLTISTVNPLPTV